MPDMKSHLQISVRNLVEFVFRQGDLSFFLGPSPSAIEGIRAHQVIQNSRPEPYRKEVPVSILIQDEEIELKVEGRIDGVFDHPDIPMIEEIKTTLSDTLFDSANGKEVHWAQLKVYAYIYGMQKEATRMKTQLTYFHLLKNKTTQHLAEFTMDELEDFFHRVIGAYIDWIKVIIQWQRTRDRSIEAATFPYPAYRKGQKELAKAVYYTLLEGKRMMVQAHPGIGKTMAIIFPALKILARGETGKIFYLTARTTGQQAAEEAVSELGEQGLRLKRVTITAREKICPYNHYECSSDCPLAAGYFDRLSDGLTYAFQHHDDLSRHEVEKISEQLRLCPYAFSRELALWADMVIADFNYAFDPGASLQYFSADNGDALPPILLVDEAHNLVDRGREMYSVEIRKSEIMKMRKSFKGDSPEIHRQLTNLNNRLNRIKRRIINENNPFLEPKELKGLMRQQRKCMDQLITRLMSPRPIPFMRQFLELMGTVLGFIRIRDMHDKSYQNFGEYQEMSRDFRLKLFCMDPSNHLEQIYRQCQGIIMFSATMSPMPYYKRLLGLEECIELKVPSPFPAENFRLMINSHISTLYRQREASKKEVGRAILAMVRQRLGNYFAFFPSYQYLIKVQEVIVQENQDLNIVAQTPNMTASERKNYLSHFVDTEDPERSTLGLAVMGGIFGEAIDLPGNRLLGVAIVGVGLPAITLEGELMKEYFAEGGLAGFDYAYQFPGLNRVFQGIGRVIRSEQDRGIALLIDQRYAQHRYYAHLTQQWQPVLVKNQEEMEQQLASFWEKANGRNSA